MVLDLKFLNYNVCRHNAMQSLQRNTDLILECLSLIINVINLLIWWVHLKSSVVVQTLLRWKNCTTILSLEDQSLQTDNGLSTKTHWNKLSCLALIMEFINSKMLEHHQKLSMISIFWSPKRSQFLIGWWWMVVINLSLKLKRFKRKLFHL